MSIFAIMSRRQLALHKLMVQGSILKDIRWSINANTPRAREHNTLTNIVQTAIVINVVMFV